MTADPFIDIEPGKPRPWRASFRDVEYPGEVVLVDEWRPELGQLGEGGGEDVHFRIVVFTRHQPVPEITDRRIACCIPGQVVKEERESYRAGGKGALRERAARYAQGRVCTKERLTIEAKEVFSTPDIADGLYDIAIALLSNAYTSLPQGLTPLKDLEGEVIAIRSYLEGIVLREGDSELAMDRVSILEQLSVEHLLANLHLWPSLKALFEWFLARYQPVYSGHHRHYHDEMAALQTALDDSRAEVDALTRLNSIAELGQPVGTELAAEYERLMAEIRPCPAREGKLTLEQTPACPRCGLSLGDEPPLKDVEGFLRRLKVALKQQQRRLSSEAVRQILAQSEEQGIDRFIKVVQTSELSALVKLLDDELIDFLSRLLREAHVNVNWRPAAAELKERFPSIEEEDIDTVAAHFAGMLKKAFDKAKKAHPGKEIRLNIKE